MTDLIKGKVRFYSKFLHPNKCQDIVSLIKWNYMHEIIHTFKKISDGYFKLPQDLVERHIYEYIKDIIPPLVDNIEFSGIDYKNCLVYVYNKSNNNKDNKDNNNREYINILPSDLISNNLNNLNNSSNNTKLFAVIYLNDDLYTSENTTFINNNEVNTSTGDILLMYDDENITRRETYNNGNGNNKYCIVLQLLYKDTNNNQNNTKKQLIVYNSVADYIKNNPIVPCSNRLKYNKAYHEHNNTVYTLTSDPNDEYSMFRWEEVMKRPRVFEITKKSVDPCLNTNRARPPTNLEDFCPNCYEILPITEDYKKCPGCLSKITDINLSIKNKILTAK